MGLTFSLASFACVGPFVGTLLAASVSGGKTRPLIGMVTFATGLALPFFLLAVFPCYLKRMPRSGGWLARVKVVMGFVILAASLKYLSSLDQVLQWGFLTRERFLAAWIVLFALAGLYLLGFLRLEGIKPDDQVDSDACSPASPFWSSPSACCPGCSAANSAISTPTSRSAAVHAASAAGGGETALVWMKNQYREALDRARREGKLVLVNFTGYACTNCHWMKANMFTRPEIAAAMKNFVLVELYTDGTDAASEANQKLQLSKFHTVAIPFYAIIDPDEKVVATFPGLTRDSAEYLAFLQQARAAGHGRAAAPRRPAPASGLPNSPRWTARPLDTASLTGKVVVVNFWATWCVPAFGRSRASTNLNKEFSPQGVAVVGVWTRKAPIASSPSSRSTPCSIPSPWAATRSTSNTISICSPSPWSSTAPASRSSASKASLPKRTSSPPLNRRYKPL